MAGEGLQHQDGHSHILASTIPNCISYDPTFAYELAVILREGLKRMHDNQENIFYYITVMNENYKHPKIPEDSEKGILKGMYLFKEFNNKGKIKIQLLGCGTILREILAAAEILSEEYNIDSDVWSVTSFNELRKRWYGKRAKKSSQSWCKTRKIICGKMFRKKRRINNSRF